MVTYAGKSAIVRPETGGFFELPAATVKAAIQELNSRAALILAGLDEFSACDKIAYDVLLRKEKG